MREAERRERNHNIHSLTEEWPQNYVWGIGNEWRNELMRAVTPFSQVSSLIIYSGARSYSYLSTGFYAQRKQLFMNVLFHSVGTT